ncbi:hypothetical protein QFC21_001574 [Naganishia friedmannii]|uniref:Uncharacterized protein n=1 Tax=Naganishia friedmannii TaxID=89922 RepID=A0ACC2W4V1_9TREE|nr:hypothetical protein QFC21_001574 [Naganishia friedmannii]
MSENKKRGRYPTPPTSGSRIPPNPDSLFPCPKKAAHVRPVGMRLTTGLPAVVPPALHERAAAAEPASTYVKFLLKLEPTDSSVSDEPQELAYLDSRRLGKLRLLPQPVTSHPPISVLGFDPYTDPPSREEFTTLLCARPRSTIKGLIMDQSFSAGVGNWVADEILHLARVHPATPVRLLTDEQVAELWRCMLDVVRIAVDVNADHSKFPKDWLFSWRWSKGKKDKNRKVKDTETGGMRLPDGSSATLKFITVGGRTSAFIEELQKLPEGVVYKEPVKRGKLIQRCPCQLVKDEDVSDSGNDSDLSVKDDETTVKQETDTALPTTVKRTSSKRVKRKAAVKAEDSSELSEVGDAGEEIPITQVSSSKRTKRKAAVKAEPSSDMSEIDGMPLDVDESKKIPVARKTKPRTAVNEADIGNKRKRTSVNAAEDHPSTNDAVSENKPDVVRRGRKRAIPARNGTPGEGVATGRGKRQKVVPQAEESSGLSSAEDE